MTRGPLLAARLGLGCAALLAGAATVESAGPPVRLAATLVADGGRALLATGEGQAWLAPGDRVGECELKRVELSYAELHCDDHRVHLRLDEAGTDGPVASPQFTRVELPPGAIEALAARPQALALGLDLVPETEHGALRGWRILRLDAGNPLYRFGFREADLVVAVAGFAASDPAALAAGLRSLPGQGAFSVQLLREQKPFELLVMAPPASPRR